MPANKGAAFLLPLLLGACAAMTGGPHASTQTAAQAKAVAFKKAYPNGLPAAGSPFSKLKLGMGVQWVRSLMGPLTSRVMHRVHFTTKLWILSDITFGMDKSADQITILKIWRYRHEGKLIFMTHHSLWHHRGRLIRIIVNPKASGFRS